MYASRNSLNLDIITNTDILPDLLEEKDKFMQDALRLAEDVSGNQTFHTVKPLLNFWAAFTASEEVRESETDEVMNADLMFY